MANHTVGPWVRTAGMGMDICAANLPHPADSSSRVCVASVFRADDGLEWAEMEANAKLVAAAPELLSALQNIVAISDRKHDAWDAAKAAIAKALGRDA